MRIRGAVLEQSLNMGPYANTQPLQVQELVLERPGDGEVLVKIEAAGLCHSDLSVVDGTRARPVPMLLGHEAAGRVLELGRGVTDLAIGQRLVLTFLPRCGMCRGCATGGRAPCEPGSAANAAGTLMNGETRLRRDGQTVNHHLGVSAFATHAVVDRRSVVPVPDDIPAEVAALLGCAVLTGGGAVLNVAPPSSGQTVAIIGLGGVGMAALLTALGEQDVEVIAIDPVAAKREQAVALGAHRAYEPDAASHSQVRADLVIEAAGVPQALELAVAITGPGGTVVTVGLPSPKALASIAPLDLVGQGRSVVGSYLGSALPERDIPMFAERWRRGRLPVEKLVSSRIRLDNINAGLDELAAGRAVRQLVTFEG